MTQVFLLALLKRPKKKETPLCNLFGLSVKETRIGLPNPETCAARSFEISRAVTSVITYAMSEDQQAFDM